MDIVLERVVPRRAIAPAAGRHGREIQVHGSGRLLQTLIENDLVDEYRLWTFPALLGSGKRLFGSGTIPAGLELIDSRSSSTGVVIGRYRRAGEIRTGSFAVDERGGVEALWASEAQG
jgi:dihydrofolate reductase